MPLVGYSLFCTIFATRKVTVESRNFSMHFLLMSSKGTPVNRFEFARIARKSFLVGLSGNMAWKISAVVKTGWTHWAL